MPSPTVTYTHSPYGATVLTTQSSAAPAIAPRTTPSHKTPTRTVAAAPQRTTIPPTVPQTAAAAYLAPASGPSCSPRLQFKPPRYNEFVREQQESWTAIPPSSSFPPGPAGVDIDPQPCSWASAQAGLSPHHHQRHSQVGYCHTTSSSASSGSTTPPSNNSIGTQQQQHPAIFDWYTPQPSWKFPTTLRVHQRLATAGCRYLRLPAQRPSPAHWATVDVTACPKLFVGQLRFEISAEQLAAVFEELTGVVTAGASYQRSGCLVLRFFNDTDRAAVRALNRKLLCDAEGLWLAETLEAEEEMDRHIQSMSVQEFRRYHLPRSTIVIENFKQD